MSDLLSAEMITQAILHEAGKLIRPSNKTKLHNATTFEISLVTAIAGMRFRTYKIPPGGHYVVKSTPNYTYEEYRWCMQPNDDNDIILSSDDYMEFKEIMIKPTAHDPAKFDWEGTVRRDGSNVPRNKTNVHNDTSFEMVVKTPRIGTLSRMGTIPIDGDYMVKYDANETYREYLFTVSANNVKDVILTTDDFIEWEAISIYMIPDHSFSWRGTTKRHAFLPNPQEKAAYEALESKASKRIKMVTSLYARLEMHLKEIKICHAQCKHFVETLSKSIQKMVGIYTNVSQNDASMWKLYQSKKLRNLVSSLDSLVNFFKSAENLLLKCGSHWKKMALVVCIPLIPGTKTCSEFDLVMRELCWIFDKIQYALYLGNELGVQWKWDTRRCNFELLVLNEETSRGGVKDDVYSRVNSDRDNLKNCLEDGSIFARKKLNYLWLWKWFSQFARYGGKEDFGAVLKRRLIAETFVSSISAPICFEINHLDLKCQAKISGGSFKKIYQGEWLEQTVAIARMVCPSIDHESLFKREVGILLKVQHPNIVVCYGYSYTQDAPPPISKRRDKASKHGTEAAGYLVMELMEGDLGSTIEKRMKLVGPFSISVALDILLQIVEAMVHLHELDVMHRDLKPGNCLVNSRFVLSKHQESEVYYDVKLTDFGSARTVDSQDVKSKKTANPGTTRWMAPEMVRPRGNYIAEYRKSADVYGFAMTFYQVITGFVPYHDYRGRNTSEFNQAVHDDKLRPTFRGSVSCPEGLKQLMIDCWHPDADSRPNFKEIQRRLWSVRKDEELSGI